MALQLDEHRKRDNPSEPSDVASPQESYTWVYKLLGAVLVGVILWVGKPVLLPLAIASLLAFLLSPLCEFLERRKLPRVASTTAVGVLAASVLFGIGFALFHGLSLIDENIGAYEQRLTAKIDTVLRRDRTDDDTGDDGSRSPLENIGTTVSKVVETATGQDLRNQPDDETPPATQPTDQPEQVTERDLLARATAAIDRNFEARDERIASAVDSGVDRIEESIGGLEDRLFDVEARPLPVQQRPVDGQALERAGEYLAIAAGPIGTLGLVAVFLLFILLQRDDLRDRIIKLAAGQRINLATQALDDASRRIGRYLRAQAFINGTYGLAVGIGLTVISYGFTGSPFPGAILWGVLCAVLRFIPYLGPWLAAAFPVFVCLGHYDTWAVFMAALAMFVVIELLTNNVLEPILYGAAVGMSDFAVIIAATVWTFLWGVEGLLVATPLTTCLVVLSKYVPMLRPIDTLLGNEPVLDPHTRLYQRLLALNEADAYEVVDDFRRQHTLTETFDVLLLPTLALSERDREAGNLTSDRSVFIRDTMRAFTSRLSEQDEPTPADSVDLSDPNLPVSQPPAVASESAVVVAVLPAKDEADETAGLMLAALLQRRGYVLDLLDDTQLASEKLAAVRRDHAAVVVISAVPPNAASQSRYLVKRLEACGAREDRLAETVVGIWDREADAKVLRRQVCNSEDRPGVRVATTLDRAVEEVRQRAEVVVAARRSSMV
ncbi:MAG: AI-2E family transporter [Planctomycetota bacterium]